MRVKRAAVAGMVVAGCLLTNGCSTATDLAAMQADAPVSLNGAVMAIYVSPQSADLYDGDPGYVVLVDSQQKYTTIETAGMDDGRLLWVDEGLAFADSGSDYLISDQVHKAVAVRSNFQEAFHYDEASNLFVGLFNKGFTGTGGYEEELVVSSQGASNVFVVEGAYTITAQCGEEIYGVAPRSGKYLSGVAKKNFEEGTGTSGQMLTRLYPLDDGAEYLIGATASPDTGEPRGDAVCRDGHVVYPTFLLDNVSRAQDTVVLRSWSITDGTLSDISLQWEDGLAVTLDDLMLSTVLGLDSDGNVLWALPDGAVVVTDPGTGVTRLLFRVPLANRDPILHQVSTAGMLWTLEEPTQAGEAVHVSQCSWDMDGQCKVIEIPGLADHLGIDMVLRSFAVPPGV